MSYSLGFITKSLGIEILTNGAVTAPFYDPSFVKIQLEILTFLVINS